jgi:Flp pilus assembly protein TadG
MMLRRKNARPGTILIESAFVYPVLFLTILAVILLGQAVFRYQQVTHMAREGSRWASVHGDAYEKDPLNTTPGRTAATPQDVYDNAIKPFGVGMDPSAITYEVTWNTLADGTTPDKRPTRVVTKVDPTTGLLQDVAQFNTVSVKVTYTWNTGLFGTIPVSSTSVNTIFY